VQEQLRRNTTTLVGTPGTHRYLLRGLLVCSTCRRRLLRQDEDRLAAQLTQADAALAQTSASRHAAAVAYCKLVAKGLDRLDDAGRQALLRLLVERFDGKNDCADAHGACALLGG
jgi:hypothetical protein